MPDNPGTSEDAESTTGTDAATAATAPADSDDVEAHCLQEYESPSAYCATYRPF